MTLPGHDKSELYRSMLTSLMVCVPSFCASVWLMETRVSWPAPMMVTVAIICVGIMNFMLCVALERARTRLGVFTMPALLGAAALVLLFVISEGMNRFVRDVGYTWLLPLVGGVMCLSLLAVFRERAMGLKLQLAFNSLALAVLWTLGETGKVSLPF